ncbi:hypothetical protein [Bacillus cereus group sp. N24]|nr:hypothetical protein [Bacillus cereus group sp. N24]MBJ7950107.1 hypothetical protein [Bacillus cereus group sp. N24]
MILDGKRLTEEGELRSAYVDLVARPKFKEIVASLKDVAEFKAEDVKVVFGYIFDTRSFKDGQLVTGKITVVRALDRVQIRHIILVNKDGEIVGEDYTIDTVNETGGLTIYNHYDKLEELASSVSGGYEFLETSVNEEVIDNKEFTPFSTVKEEGWGISFCLAGGYNHCGPGCGDGMSRGGTPINGVDSCCRSHDRCWSNFGQDDACCDKTLVNCVKSARSSGPVAADLIVGYFSWNARNC